MQIIFNLSYNCLGYSRGSLLSVIRIKICIFTRHYCFYFPEVLNEFIYLFILERIHFLIVLPFRYLDINTKSVRHYRMTHWDEVQFLSHFHELVVTSLTVNLVYL